MLKRLFIMLVLGIASFSAIAQSDDPEPGGTTPNPSVPPSISLTYNASLSRLAAPGSVLLIANAEAYDSTIANISIHKGSTLLGTVKAGTNTFAWNNVPAGTHVLTAVATDSRGLWSRSAPLSVTVTGNAAPTVALTATLTGATAPGSIALSATASDSDGSISKVEFFNGTALLATVTQAPYTFTWSNVAAGSFSLSARATDNVGATTSTQPQVVTVAAAGAQVYYLYADQVNAAREITSAAGTVVWRADVTEPFGANIPNENPSYTGTFTYQKRFPGQYIDMETGLHYNYHRDYDPRMGRYVQSDPIGLRGGVNGFSYVESNPLVKVDPSGKIALILPAIPSIAAFVKTTFFIGSAAAVAYGASQVAQPNGMAANDGLICKPDDPCFVSQRALNLERSNLLDFAGVTPASDIETLIAINNMIIQFNRKVQAHNRTCPANPVLPLPTISTGA